MTDVSEMYDYDRFESEYEETEPGLPENICGALYNVFNSRKAPADSAGPEVDPEPEYLWDLARLAYPEQKIKTGGIKNPEKDQTSDYQKFRKSLSEPTRQALDTIMNYSVASFCVTPPPITAEQLSRSKEILGQIWPMTSDKYRKLQNIFIETTRATGIADERDLQNYLVPRQRMLDEQLKAINESDAIENAAGMKQGLNEILDLINLSTKNQDFAPCYILKSEREAVARLFLYENFFRMRLAHPCLEDWTNAYQKMEAVQSVEERAEILKAWLDENIEFTEESLTDKIGSFLGRGPKPERKDPLYAEADRIAADFTSLLSGQWAENMLSDNFRLRLNKTVRDYIEQLPDYFILRNGRVEYTPTFENLRLQCAQTILELYEMPQKKTFLFTEFFGANRPTDFIADLTLVRKSADIAGLDPSQRLKPTAKSRAILGDRTAVLDYLANKDNPFRDDVLSFHFNETVAAKADVPPTPPATRRPPDDSMAPL